MEENGSELASCAQIAQTLGVFRMIFLLGVPIVTFCDKRKDSRLQVEPCVLPTSGFCCTDVLRLLLYSFQSVFDFFLDICPKSDYNGTRPFSDERSLYR